LLNGIYESSSLFCLSVEFKDLSLITVNSEVNFINLGGVIVEDWINLLVLVLELLNFR